MVWVVFVVYTILNNIECDFVAYYVESHNKSVQDYKLYYINDFKMYKDVLLKTTSSVN